MIRPDFFRRGARVGGGDDGPPHDDEVRAGRLGVVAVAVAVAIAVGAVAVPVAVAIACLVFRK